MFDDLFAREPLFGKPLAGITCTNGRDAGCTLNKGMRSACDFSDIFRAVASALAVFDAYSHMLHAWNEYVPEAMDIDFLSGRARIHLQFFRSKKCIRGTVENR